MHYSRNMTRFCCIRSETNRGFSRPVPMRFSLPFIPKCHWFVEHPERRMTDGTNSSSLPEQLFEFLVINGYLLRYDICIHLSKLVFYNMRTYWQGFVDFCCSQSAHEVTVSPTFQQWGTKTHRDLNLPPEMWKPVSLHIHGPFLSISNSRNHVTFRSSVKWITKFSSEHQFACESYSTTHCVRHWILLVLIRYELRPTTPVW